jgi:hypothetical protein
MKRLKTKETVKQIIIRITNDKTLKPQPSGWQLERLTVLINDFNNYGSESYLNCPLFPNSKTSTKMLFDFFKIEIE